MYFLTKKIIIKFHVQIRKEDELFYTKPKLKGIKLKKKLKL